MIQYNFMSDIVGNYKQANSIADLASGGVIVRTPKCGVSVRIAIYRKTVKDRQILIVTS